MGDGDALIDPAVAPKVPDTLRELTSDNSEGRPILETLTPRALDVLRGCTTNTELSWRTVFSGQPSKHTPRGS